MHLACLLRARAQDSVSKCCAHELLPHMCNVRDSDLPSNTKDNTRKKQKKKTSRQAAVQLTFSFVMDTAVLAHLLGFFRIEWYAVLSGIAAPILNSCVVEASQGVSGQPSTQFSPSNLPASHWIQLLLHVLQVVHSIAAGRMQSTRCVSSCVSNPYAG